MRFAIIDEYNVVKNIAIGEYPLADNWIASDTAVTGDRYENGIFASLEPDINTQWSAIRKERNTLLASCDWTQLSDARVDALAWAVYRQALRDITTQQDPFNIAWPQEPE